MSNNSLISLTASNRKFSMWFCRFFARSVNSLSSMSTLSLAFLNSLNHGSLSLYSFLANLISALQGYDPHLGFHLKGPSFEALCVVISAFQN